MTSVMFITEKLPETTCEVIAITKKGIKTLQYRHKTKEFGEVSFDYSGNYEMWEKYEVSGWVDPQDFVIQ